MKTNNLSKKSFLTSMILALSSVFMSRKNAGAVASAPNGYVGGGSPIFIPQRKKLKGYQREARRCSFGKNR